MPQQQRKAPGNDFFRYLPGSQPTAAGLWNLTLVAGGRTRIRPHQPYPPPGHPRDHTLDHRGRVLQEWQLVLISSGRGTFWGDDDQPQPIAVGDVLVLAPGQRHRYRPDLRSGWHEHWLACVGSPPNQLAVPPGVHRRQAGGWADALVAAIDLLHQQPPGWQSIAEALLALAWARLAAAQQALHAGSATDQLVQQMAARLQTGEADALPLVLGLVRRSGLSASHVRRRFRQLLGASPRTYALRIRLERARQLLAQPGSTIEAVAASLGFSSPFHLSNLCLRHLGQRPSHLRSPNFFRGDFLQEKKRKGGA